MWYCRWLKKDIIDYVGYDCMDILDDIYYLAKKRHDYTLIDLIDEYKSLESGEKI